MVMILCRKGKKNIRVKEQPSERGTVFTRYTSDKGLVSSIYKEHTYTKVNFKKGNNLIKRSI